MQTQNLHREKKNMPQNIHIKMSFGARLCNTLYFCDKMEQPYWEKLQVTKDCIFPWQLPLWTDLNVTRQEINRSSDRDMIISWNFTVITKPFILAVINACASDMWSGIHGKHMVTTESLPVQLVGFWCNVSAKCCFTNYFTCHNFYIPDFFLVIIVNNNKTSLILVKNIVLYISSLLHDYRLSMTLNSTDNRSISCLAVFLYHLINDWSVGKHQTA